MESSDNGFFAYAEGAKIAFEISAKLPPVCLKCGKHKQRLHWRRTRFSAVKSMGANFAAVVGGAPALMASAVNPDWKKDVGKINRTTLHIPICMSCRIKRWLAVALLLGAICFAGAPWFTHVPWRGANAFFLGIFAVVAGIIAFHLTGLRSDRIDVEQDRHIADVIRLHGVHRLARIAILDASEGRYEP